VPSGFASTPPHKVPPTKSTYSIGPEAVGNSRTATPSVAVRFVLLARLDQLADLSQLTVDRHASDLGDENRLPRNQVPTR
jgi:hypothetical protein